jgi:hypothetical protein
LRRGRLDLEKDEHGKEEEHDDKYKCREDDGEDTIVAAGGRAFDARHSVALYSVSVVARLALAARRRVAHFRHSFALRRVVAELFVAGGAAFTDVGGVLVFQGSANTGLGVFARQKFVSLRNEALVGAVFDAVVAPVSGLGFDLRPSDWALAVGAYGALGWGGGGGGATDVYV